MEGNWRPTREASMASSVDASSGDWRTQLQPEARQRVVNKIMETLKRHLPISVPEGLNEIRKIVNRFEEKIYTAASSQSDYLRKISLKMLSMEVKTQQSAPINPAISNTGAVNQNPTDLGILYAPVTFSCPNHPHKRQQISANRSIINCESYSTLEDDYSNTKRMKVSVVSGKVKPEKPTSSCHVCMAGTEKPKEPTFSCPICMCALVSPFTTVCGHIFCEACIKAAIQRQKKCPTCRTKLGGRNNIHRVFLPTID